MDPYVTDTPSVIAARYRVLRELGRGGMGVVYVVEHIHTGDQLALKVLFGTAAQDPGSVQRFAREARASARIKSDHVVKVVDADVAPELQGAPFLVMELLSGSDLDQMLHARGRLPAPEVVHYLGQAARALDKAHDLGVVHRDLKPGNLFLHHREDGSTIVKVLDFGIAKFLGEQTADPTSVSVTRTGAMMGTPLYMAPEQARGQIARIAPTTDVWAMGLIALQLLTGEPYFNASNVSDLLVQVLSEPLYPPRMRWPWLPETIDGWFARSCARDPAERFPRVGEQIRALRSALGLGAEGAAEDPSSLRGDVQKTRPDAPSAPAFLVAPTTAATNPNRDTGNVEAPAKSRALPIALGLGLVVLVGASSAVWVVRDRASRPPLSAMPDGGATVATTTATPVETSRPASSALAQVAAPSAVATTAPAPATTSLDASVVPPPPPVESPPHHTPAPPPVRQPPAPHPTAAANCDPPFTIDARGHHIPKPECL